MDQTEAWVREAVSGHGFSRAQDFLIPVFLSDSEGANATEEESKDPKDSSCAMQRQGVSHDTRKLQTALCPIKRDAESVKH